jgi:hypothetical protein
VLAAQARRDWRCLLALSARAPTASLAELMRSREAQVRPWGAGGLGAAPRGAAGRWPRADLHTAAPQLLRPAVGLGGPGAW